MADLRDYLDRLVGADVSLSPLEEELVGLQEGGNADLHVEALLWCVRAGRVYLQAAAVLARNGIPVQEVVSDGPDAAERAEETGLLRPGDVDRAGEATVAAERAVLELDQADAEWFLAHLRDFGCPWCGRPNRGVFVPDKTPVLDVYPSDRLRKCWQCGEVLVIFADGLLRMP